jgi:hypothetical protein
MPALGIGGLEGIAKMAREAEGSGRRVGVGREIGDGVSEGLKDAEKPAPAEDAAKEAQEVGWEIRAQKPLPAVEETPKNGEEIDMEVPDHKKRYFNERPDGSRVKEKKYKEDPWKQARGAPSEEWQPQAWSPNVAATRR